MAPLPTGKGCGEQWVRMRYAEEVKAYRNRSARARTALVVAIDADNRQVSDRVSQLGDALADAGLAAPLNATGYSVACGTPVLQPDQSQQ